MPDNDLNETPNPFNLLMTHDTTKSYKLEYETFTYNFSIRLGSWSFYCV